MLEIKWVWAIGTENFSALYNLLVIAILRPQQIVTASSKIIYEVQCINSALCAFPNDTNGQVCKYGWSSFPAFRIIVPCKSALYRIHHWSCCLQFQDRKNRFKNNLSSIIQSSITCWTVLPGELLQLHTLFLDQVAKVASLKVKANLEYHIQPLTLRKFKKSRKKGGVC